jgi:phage terminase large subunit
LAARPLTKRISTGYIPRPIQAELHRKLKRFSVVCAHRRFGKSVFAINEMIDAGLRCQLHNPRVAYLAPLFSQAKRIAWDYLKQYTANIPGATPNEADLRIDIPRPALKDTVRLMLLGADNPVSLKGIYLDLAILDEFAEMNPAAWREVIRPTLSDRAGRAIFISTPKGRNLFWEMYNRASAGTDPEWFAALYRADQTGIISDAELASAKRELSEGEYEQEFLCSFQAGMVGAYYSKEIALAEEQERITNVPYDSAVPVSMYFDLGLNDVMSVWFHQRVGRSHQFIDYEEGPDLSIPEWVRIIRKKPYNLGEFVLPHDAAARDLSTGKSREEMFRSLGAKTRIIPRLDIMDGIHAVRRVFNQCWFDREKCKKGIEALMNYQRKWDGQSNTFSTKPLHNHASNGADAFRTFAVGVDERDELTTRNLPRKAVSDWDVFSI